VPNTPAARGSACVRARRARYGTAPPRCLLPAVAILLARLRRPARLTLGASFWLTRADQFRKSVARESVRLVRLCLVHTPKPRWFVPSGKLDGGAVEGSEWKEGGCRATRDGRQHRNPLVLGIMKDYGPAF